jgi:hypothetical protein
VCHRDFKVTTSTPEIYSHPIIKDNYVCPLCESKVTKLKVTLTCNKCKKEFRTKILMENKEKYSPEWECPFCVKVEDKRDKRRKTLELNCDCCKSKRGLCFQPDLNCTLSSDYVVFGGAKELYSTKKDCTILSVDSVDMSRDDIHSIKYSMLYNDKYLVSTHNIVFIKQRLGSKKNFKNKVTLYSFNKEKKKFMQSYEQTFDKGVDWIVPTRDKIRETLEAVK